MTILPFARPPLEPAARSTETRLPLESHFPPLPATWCWLCCAPLCRIGNELFHGWQPQPEPLPLTVRDLQHYAAFAERRAS